MLKVRQRPARTLPVAVLDLVLAGVAVVRRAIRWVGRVPPVRRGDRLLATAIVAAALVTVSLTGYLVVTLLRTPNQLAPLGMAPVPIPPPEQSADGPTDGASGSATPPASSPLPPTPTEPSERPRSVPEPSVSRPPAPPPALAARYATEDLTLFNYTASVTISNPGRGSATGWTLAITLPRSTQAVGAVAGAKASRDGTTWTFVPDQSTRLVPGGGSVQIRFRVDGSLFDSGPTSCTINGRHCETASAAQ